MVLATPPRAPKKKFRFSFNDDDEDTLDTLKGIPTWPEQDLLKAINCESVLQARDEVPPDDRSITPSMGLQAGNKDDGHDSPLGLTSGHALVEEDLGNREPQVGDVLDGLSNTQLRKFCKNLGLHPAGNRRMLLGKIHSHDMIETKAALRDFLPELETGDPTDGDNDGECEFPRPPGYSDSDWKAIVAVLRNPAGR